MSTKAGGRTQPPASGRCSGVCHPSTHVDALPLFNGLTSYSPRRRPWSFRPPLSRLRRSRFLRENKHRASGPATWANAVTAPGVAVDRLTVPISVHLLDPITVHCLEGHLLARRLRNTGRQGHQNADANGYAANVGGVDHNRRPRECLPGPMNIAGISMEPKVT
jgi:hypothetical protein